MTTIINTNKQFFWSTIQKNLVFLLLLLMFASCARKQALKAETFKTQSGWGYTIAYKNKILIKQSIIPVINDNKSFSTEDDALKVADLVVNKLNQNISPTVTKKDLILLKIKF
ncbi:DUF4907 domain-containing protein [Flavobacterium reichenbachii]|uniref:DUF4907 domain-containing protein n=1 Tax=Flavobacterium reichenbachii TaxID=362418 RepID=A0A085ZQT4_9FLAO|nr:DUF4907 domain-containing protein [Flavobacterium reichenbachii]KFF06798.1 hypothetical protein IW19_15355 [Flavobacterium reichenbachii]OXB18603.1 DUF4907 domain-containing protein [Flavobacterium reichenbachii]